MITIDLVVILLAAFKIRTKGQTRRSAAHKMLVFRRVGGWVPIRFGEDEPDNCLSVVTELALSFF